MENANTTIELSGLTPLEAQELKAALVSAGCDPRHSVQIAEAPSAVGGTRKGEPFTMIAIVVVSQLAITGLALYLAKGRSRVHKKESLTIKRPDGETIIHQIEISADKEDAIAADLMGKVGTLNIPIPKA